MKNTVEQTKRDGYYSGVFTAVCAEMRLSVSMCVAVCICMFVYYICVCVCVREHVRRGGLGGRSEMTELLN